MKNKPIIGFLGIGGIGMSNLAQYALHAGYSVYGYDRTPSAITQFLIKKGANIGFEDNPDFFPKTITEWVVTPAIPKNSALFQFALESGKPIRKRAEYLGNLVANKRVLAVAGTHGKTSISALLTHILHINNFPVSAFLGGWSINLDSNSLITDSNWVVVEADEFDRSFLHLNPEYALVSAMDADHLDIYTDIEGMRMGYMQFLSQVKNGLVIHKSISNQIEIPTSISKTTYGENGNWNLQTVTALESSILAEFSSPTNQTFQFKLPMLGIHNAENALGAIALASQTGIPTSQLCSALASFRGVKRRMELVYNESDCYIYDDYAHHPVEVIAAIHALQSHFPKHTICIAFHPHLYSRTRDLAQEFGEALSIADTVYIHPIYPAREEPIPGITNASLAPFCTASNLTIASTHSDLLKWIQVCSNTHSKVVFGFLGAGDINLLIPESIEEIHKTRGRYAQ